MLLKLSIGVVLLNLGAAVVVGPGQKSEANEDGIPLYIDNRSGEPVEITSDGSGATVKIGEGKGAISQSFDTDWGKVTLINNGRTTLNFNFTPKHINIVVGLAAGEWTEVME